MASKAKDTGAPPVSPESIFKLATGFMAAKHFFVASEVGLFTGLATGAATLDELAARTGIARKRLRILADAMVAVGFLEKQNNRYQNGPAAAAFLAGATSTDLRPLLRFWDRLSYPTWMKFEEAIRTGHGQGSMRLSPEDQTIFSEGVEAIQAGPARALAEVYDFGRHQRVLDLGGGTGSWLRAILLRFGHLKATLVELPEAAAVARERLAADPATKDVEVVAADFFSDQLPGGHDAVLIANVIHLFSPERNVELLRRTRELVPDGARLLIADFWTNATHTEPAMAAVMAGEFLAITGEGDVYSREEVGEWLDATGWQTLEHKTLTGPVSVVVAETRG